MTARHLIVSGRVQGVFFRQSTLRRAQELGVRGWVRNRPDGTVEAYVVGEDEGVAALEAWAHDGPPSAAVSGVEAQDAPVEDHDRFEVR